MFLEEALVSSGQFSPALEADLADLRLMMGLGPKEAERVEAEIKEKTYRWGPGKHLGTQGGEGREASVGLHLAAWGRGCGW